MQSYASLFSVLFLLATGLQVSAVDPAAAAGCTSVSTHTLPTVTNTIDLPTSTLAGRGDQPQTAGSTAAGTTLTSATQSTRPETTGKASASTSVPPQSTGSGGPVVASASDLQRRSVLQLSALIAVIGGVLVA